MKHDAGELLPFYANGTLDEADRARVEAELAVCASCAEELRELQALAGALRARAADAPPLAPAALAAALARIDAAPGAPAGPFSRAAFARGGFARAPFARRSWWSVPARYAAASVLVVGFGATAAAALHAYESATRTTLGVTMPHSASDAVFVTRLPGTTAKAAAPPRAAGASRGAAAPTTVERQQRLAKRAHLALLVPDVEASLRSARAAIRAHGGEVTGLDDATPQSAGEVHAASLDAEVPAANLDATLDALTALGGVRNRTVTAEDVDATIVDEEAQLDNLRREEADLRRLMDRGGKVDEILQVEQSLSDVRGRIEELEGRHRANLHRVATSTIALELSEDRPDALPAKPGPSARIDGAWNAGLRALSDTVVAVVSGLAWCVAYAPVLGAGVAAYATVRRLRRRSRAA